jgi:hypothetical protein
MSARRCHCDSGTACCGEVGAQIENQSNNPLLRIEQFNLHSQRLSRCDAHRSQIANTQQPAARQHKEPAREAAGPIAEKSIPRNAIADGAKSAATRAPAQGYRFSIADEEALTITNGAHADSLAYE